MARNSSSSSKISIWWDIENCHVPRDVDPHSIALNLRSALHHSDLNGPITIDVFGDTKNLDHKILEALSSTGITISHIPSGNKDAADKAILVAMLFWALDNPPPAHFLLISGDGDFANALHRLRLKGYDILLVRPDQPVKPALLGAATSIWYWTNVARGQISQPEGKKGPNKDSSAINRKTLFDPLDNVENAVHRTPSLSSDMTNSKVARAHDYTHERSSSMAENGRARMGFAHSQFSEFNGDRNVSLEDVEPIGRGTQCELDLGAQRAKMVSLDQSLNTRNTNKQLHIPGQHLSRSGSGGPCLPKQYEGYEYPNKICDFNLQGPLRTAWSMPVMSGCLERLPQHAQRAYNSNLSKVMKTFERLEMDGLVPTLENLQDCLCYWDKSNEKFDLKQVLDVALNLGHVEKLSGARSGDTAFIPIRTQLWRFYKGHDMGYAFSNILLEDFRHFLCCSKNWQFFVHSQSMYEAAQRLKHDGPVEIRKLALGEIICFLDQAIWKWKWLRFQKTPTFVLSIESQAVFVQGPNEEVSSISLKSSQQQKEVPLDSSSRDTNNSVYKTSEVLQRLRHWLKETADSRNDYDISLVPKDFLCATGIQLDIGKLGFSKLHKLLEQFSDVVTIEVGRKGMKVLRPVPGPQDKQQKGIPSGPQDMQQKGHIGSPQGKDLKLSLRSTGPDQPVGRTHLGPVQDSSDWPATKENPLMKKLRNWLLHLPSLKQGYDISSIKKDFHQDTGMILDPPSLGYSKVKEIVKIFSEDFHVECPRPGSCLIFSNNGILPASKSNAGSNCNSRGEILKNGDETHSKLSQQQNRIASRQRKEKQPSIRTVDGKTLGVAESTKEALLTTVFSSQLSSLDSLSLNDGQLSTNGQLIGEEADK